MEHEVAEPDRCRADGARVYLGVVLRENAAGAQSAVYRLADAAVLEANGDGAGVGRAAVESGRVHLDGLRPHHVPYPVQVVTGVVQDAVAPVRAVVVVRVLVLPGVDPAREQDEVGPSDHLPQPLCDGRVLEPPAAHKLNAGLVHRLLKAPRLVERHGQRLLAEDVLAGLARPDGDLGVRVMGRTDQHRVHPVVLQDAVEIGRVVVRLALLGALPRRGLHHVHRGHEAHLGRVEDIGQVRSADPPAANQSRP